MECLDANKLMWELTSEYDKMGPASTLVLVGKDQLL